jgi:hypothetical protein
LQAPKTPPSTSTQIADSATRPRANSDPIAASRRTPCCCLEAFLRSVESLSVGPLDELLHLFGRECLALAKLEERIQQDRSQRHHFRKQGLFRNIGLLPFIGVGSLQEHLAAPLAQRQTFTLSQSHKLFVFGLGHLRTNGSIPQLIGWHNQNLQEGTSKKTIRSNMSEQNKEVNEERRKLTASARSSLTRAA